MPEMPERDEYGDIPGQGGTQWAGMDTVLPDHDIHVQGSIHTAKGNRFWLTQPRPQGVSPEQWEAFLTARWERIFGNKEQA